MTMPINKELLIKSLEKITNSKVEGMTVSNEFYEELHGICRMIDEFDEMFDNKE